jgi:hypothetical protein
MKPIIFAIIICLLVDVYFLIEDRIQKFIRKLKQKKLDKK